MKNKQFLKNLTILPVFAILSFFLIAPQALSNETTKQNSLLDNNTSQEAITTMPSDEEILRIVKSYNLEPSQEEVVFRDVKKKLEEIVAKNKMKTNTEN